MAGEKTVIAATVEVKVVGKESITGLNKEVKEVTSNLKDTSETAKKTSKDIDNSTGSFSKLKGQIGTLPGPLGQAQEGVGKLGTAFKALIANPIGLVILAIVAALALLYKAFTNSFEGAQKLEQVFAGVKAVVQSLIDNITKVAGAIVKLMKFDFSGAISDIKGVVNEAGAAFTAMSNLTKQAQALHKEQLANDLDQAERAKKLAILREQATDESIPLAKRKAALKELQADAEKNAQDDIDLAKRTTENKIAQLTLEKDGAKKNQDEITKLKIDQINVETENANELRRINKQVTAAEKQEAAERKTLHDEAVARTKARTAAEQEAEKQRLAIIEREIEAARKKGKIDLENAEAQIKDQIAKNEAAAAQAILDNDRKIDPAAIRAQNAVLANSIIVQDEEQKTEYMLELAQREADGRKAILGGVADALGTLSELAGKETAIGKGLAIAQTTINTYQAGFAAFKGMVSTIPGPVGIALGVVAAAGALASGIAAVKKIVAVKVPGGSAGGGSSPTGLPLPTAPVAPKATSTTIDPTQFEQIGNAAAPARVYMVESDGANTSERISRLNRAARIG